MGLKGWMTSIPLSLCLAHSSSTATSLPYTYNDCRFSWGRSRSLHPPAVAKERLLVGVGGTSMSSLTGQQTVIAAAGGASSRFSHITILGIFFPLSFLCQLCPPFFSFPLPLCLSLFGWGRGWVKEESRERDGREATSLFMLSLLLTLGG